MSVGMCMSANMLPAGMIKVRAYSCVRAASSTGTFGDELPARHAVKCLNNALCTTQNEPCPRRDVVAIGQRNTASGLSA